MISKIRDKGQVNLAQVLQQMGACRRYLQPRGGWLRATRLHGRLSAGEVARRLGVSRQLPLQFERAEANNSITLKSLRSMADALGYDLVYALVPKDKKAPLPDRKKPVRSTLDVLRKIL
jgi:transcriptional regulator with XRE-family HTH domain